MNRRAWVALGLTLLTAAACDRGPGDQPGLEDAGPVITGFARVAKGLDTLAPAVAASGGGANPPAAVVGSLVNVGEAAREVLDAAEPVGPAGVAAVQRALADAADEVVRHLVTAAGGRDEGGRLVLAPPATMAFHLGGQPAPLDGDRSERGLDQSRQRLADDLTLEVDRFVYVALLANPDTRAAFAPRLSPADLPVDVDPALNLSVATREEWQDELFDEQDRLVVPSPFDARRWKAFIGWAWAVNPTLRNQVSDLGIEAIRAMKR